MQTSEIRAKLGLKNVRKFRVRKKGPKILSPKFFAFNVVLIFCEIMLPFFP